MRTNATLYQYNCPTKGAGRAWKGRKLDAGQTQCRRRETPWTHRRSAKKHGRMRDADGSISYAQAHMIFIVFGSFTA